MIQRLMPTCRVTELAVIVSFRNHQCPRVAGIPVGVGLKRNGGDERVFGSPSREAVPQAIPRPTGRRMPPRPVLTRFGRQPPSQRIAVAVGLHHRAVRAR